MRPEDERNGRQGRLARVELIPGGKHRERRETNSHRAGTRKPERAAGISAPHARTRPLNEMVSCPRPRVQCDRRSGRQPPATPARATPATWRNEDVALTPEYHREAHSSARGRVAQGHDDQHSHGNEAYGSGHKPPLLFPTSAPEVDEEILRSG
jgi:hypothetical protein